MKNAAKADDAALAAALESYHREKVTNNQTISERLKREHGIVMRFVLPSRMPPLRLDTIPARQPSNVAEKNLIYKGAGVHPSQSQLIKHVSL